MNNVKTAALLAGMAGLVMAIGSFWGQSGLIMAFGFSVVMIGGSYWFSDRLAIALEQLRDPAFDALLAPAVAFDQLPQAMRELAAGRGTTLCQVINYPEEPSHV